MSEQDHPPEPEKEAPSRRPYVKPTLTVHGTLGTLTAGGPLAKRGDLPRSAAS